MPIFIAVITTLGQSAKNPTGPVLEKQQVYDSVGEATGGYLGGREAGRAPEPRSLDCVCILSSY